MPKAVAVFCFCRTPAHPPARPDGAAGDREYMTSLMTCIAHPIKGLWVPAREAGGLLERPYRKISDFEEHLIAAHRTYVRT